MFKKLTLAILLLSGMLYAEMNGGMEKGKSEGKPMGGMAMYQSVDKKDAEILMKNDSKEYCPNCGMYLPKFYKTNHAVKLKDGEVRQYCSIYCLVEETELTVLRDKKDQIEQIMVVDVPSLKFIDAKTAHYVVGSKKPGTMTTASKYAFAKAEDAEAFAKENGGTVTNFDGAYQTALKDFAKDTALVYNNRSTKMYNMGKKMFEEQCDKAAIEKLHAHTMGDLKQMIKESNACGAGLQDGQLQAVMLYYWDVKMQNFEKSFGKNEEVQKYINEYKKAK